MNRAIYPIIFICTIFIVGYFYLVSNRVVESKFEDVVPTPSQEIYTHVDGNKISTASKRTEVTKDSTSWRDIANYEASPFPAEIPLNGATSIYPLSPEQLYLDNIAQAEGGNAHSQMLVARALVDCKGARSQAKILQMEMTNTIPENTLAQTQALSDRCSELSAIISEDMLKNWSLHYDWLRKAKDGGDATARVWYAGIHPEQYNWSQTSELILQGIRSAEPGDYFIYTQIPTFIAQHSEDEELILAWQLGICRAQNFCNIDIMIDYLNYHEKPHYAEEILLRSKAITSAIESQNIEDIARFFPE